MEQSNNSHQHSDLSATIHMLGDLLGIVIKELESEELFETEELIRQSSKAWRMGYSAAGKVVADTLNTLKPQNARAIASAFALYLDLVNLAEDHEKAAILQNEELKCYPDPVPGSISDAVLQIKQKGVSVETMSELLENLSIELVLTAHPTEAKRRTILSKLQRISQLVGNIKQCDLSPADEQIYRKDLHAEVAALWLTDRSRTNRPAVTDEVRTGLFFIDEVFWNLLPRIYDTFDQALALSYPDVTTRPDWLKLASWIGGDRDGNPYVTAKVTAESLRLHRGLAIEKYRSALRLLSRRLSLSVRRFASLPALQSWVDSHRPFPEHAAYIEERYGSEPFRLALSLLSADLATASTDDMRSKLLSKEPHHALIHAGTMTDLIGSIIREMPASIALTGPHTLFRQMQIFGLHTAHLHLREDSSRLNAALGEILRGLNIEMNFDAMNTDNRINLLTGLFKEASPLMSEHPGITPYTSETLALFQLVSRVYSTYGSEPVGPLIISMTHNAADVLAALLLSRWMGCEHCLQIVPLFETIDNLGDAPRILTALFENPVYRVYLNAQRNSQTVMIGYSDTNKDGGYLAANWALYKAQEEIALVCRNHGIQLTIFHGRGGPTARGGGPANRAIRAQPPGSINGRFWLTEQGEVVSSRYSNIYLAQRHVEEIVHAVLLSSLKETHHVTSITRKWHDALTEMSAHARSAYNSLIYETDGFVDFWQHATPIDEITRLRIGSRPESRGQRRNDVKHIRAIPWVFSWMQSRYNLPGWFGMGSGLRHIKDLHLLKEMYAGWPFFRSLFDNTEMTLLLADMKIANLYADLVPDRNMAIKIFTQIKDEYKQTEEAILSVTGQSALMDNDPRLRRSLQLRNPYIDPLNYLQVEMLRRLRNLSNPESSEADELREVVVITINGIAAGLRNTG